MKSEWTTPLSERLDEEEIEMARTIILYAVASFTLRLSFGQTPDFGTEVERAYEDWKQENIKWCSPPEREEATND